MPRPTRAHGRPASPVVPTTWAASHRPVLAGTRRATLAVRRDTTTQVWDDDLEQNVTVPMVPHYTGTCRVQALGNQARPQVIAGDREVTADYLITTDVTGAAATDQPAEGDLAVVTDTGDTVLEGRTLQVRQVVTGTELFERYLFCTLD